MTASVYELPVAQVTPTGATGGETPTGSPACSTTANASIDPQPKGWDPHPPAPIKVRAVNGLQRFS